MDFADIKNYIAFRKIFGNDQRFANEDEGLKTAFLEADKYQWSKEELKAYDNVTIKEQDERGERTKAATNAKMEVAKNLKEMGLSNADIKKATGLSDDEINMI